MSSKSDAPSGSSSPLASEFSDDTITALGLLTIASSHAEHAVFMQTQRLLSHPDPIDIVTYVVLHGVQMQPLLGQARALTYVKVQPLHQDPVFRALNKIQETYTLRNDIIHGAMLAESDGISIVRFPLKKGKKQPRLKRTVSDIFRIASDMIDYCQDLDVSLTAAGIRRLSELP